MEIHLDSRGEPLIEKHLRSGRYKSPEHVVVSALEALGQSDQDLLEKGERRRAVRDMLAFAAKYGFVLGAELRIRDLIHEGHKY